MLRSKPKRDCRADLRQKWDRDFLACLKIWKEKVGDFCGDLNWAHAEIDLAIHKQCSNHGFTPEERAGIFRVVTRFVTRSVN